MPTLSMVQNDTAPGITFNIKRGTAVVDLTGATVKFKIKNNDTSTRTNDAANTCTITSPTGGICTYTFNTGDLASATSYNCDLEITYSSGKIETYPKYVTIIARPEA